MPRKVRVDLHTCYAVQSVSASSISGMTLRVTSHINEDTIPMINAPKILSTGIKEGICTETTERLEEGLPNMPTCGMPNDGWGPRLNALTTAAAS